MELGDDVILTNDQLLFSIILMGRAMLSNRKLSNRDADLQELMDLLNDIAEPHGLLVTIGE